MLKSTSVAVEQSPDATRVVCIKGAPGSVRVVDSVQLSGGADSSPTQVVTSLKSRKLPTGGVVLGVGGQASTLRYNLVPPVPDWRLELIMKYELEEMAEKSGEPLSSDWKQIDAAGSESADLVLLVGLGKDKIVQPVIDEFEAAKARVRNVVPHAVALFHAYRQPIAGTPRETVLLVDFGERESNIALGRDGKLIFARTVNAGGAQLVESIASALSLDPTKAAKVRDQLCEGTLPEALAESARPALRSAFGQFVSVLESSVTFCRAQTKITDLEIDRVLVSGTSARVPGLVEYVRDRLDWPVELHEPDVQGEFDGDACAWVIPVGLAASAFDSKGTVLDLLPAEAKTKREFRERTVFLYGAAGLLVLSLIVCFAGGLLAGSNAAKLTKKVQQNENQVADWRNEMQSAHEENRRIESQLGRLGRSVADASHSVGLIELVRKSLPSEISISEARFERETVDERVYLTLTVSGRSDNSEDRGLETIQGLQRTLEERPEVEWVEATSEDSPNGGFYPFVLRLSPDERAPEGERRGPTRGRRRG